MKFRFVSLGFLSIFLSLFSLPILALAISPSSISVDVMPPNPSPNENVTITLSSFSANLDSVAITWWLNGKNSLSGIGKKTFLLTAPASGSESTVTAKIALPDGDIEKKIVIRPSVMVLLWQANDSFVPPFYHGKAMPTAESEMKVVAMPEIRVGGVVSNPKNMTYLWKKDYANVEEGSGYGKNFFVYNNDYLEDASNIGVTASTLDQRYSSDGSISISQTEPQILFYRKDTKVGIEWQNAIGSSHKITGEEILVAIPYFLSPKNIGTPRLDWRWTINGELTPVNDFRKNLIPLRVESGVTGISKLRLQIDSKDKIFQSVSKEINIEY